MSKVVDGECNRLYKWQQGIGEGNSAMTRERESKENMNKEVGERMGETAEFLQSGLGA